MGKAAGTQLAPRSYQELPKKGFRQARREKKQCAAMFGSVNKLAAMEEKWQRDRLVSISRQKMVELDREPSDKMLRKAVLVRNTHSALKTWKAGEERESESVFAFRF